MPDELQPTADTGYTGADQKFSPGTTMPEIELAPAGARPTSIVRPYHFRAARGALGWKMGDVREMLEKRLGRRLANEAVAKLEHSEKINTMRIIDVYTAAIEMYQEAGITFTERGVELDPERIPVDS